VTRRAWLAVTAAAAVIVLAVIFVRFHGWQDVTAGTAGTYCGVHVQSREISLYCESGH
jgi:hypothetical protein